MILDELEPRELEILAKQLKPPPLVTKPTNGYDQSMWFSEWTTINIPTSTPTRTTAWHAIQHPERWVD